MTSPAAIQTYLKEIELAFAQGNATEHTYRPFLANLIKHLLPDVTATNEPKRISCGAPDIIVTQTQGNIPIGYFEAKNINKSLDKEENSAQLERYLGSLNNLILTDYLEFRWFVNGEKKETVRLATTSGKKLKVDVAAAPALADLLNRFFSLNVPTVSNPQDLAQRMAGLARLLREVTTNTLKQENTDGTLHDQLESFRQVLLPGLTREDFADMYSQTLCYGLFAARCNMQGGGQFDRFSAVRFIPKTNPFLQKTFYHMSGPDLDDQISWLVDDIANLLNRADIAAILQDFGKDTYREDPVVHFYETFLAAYDPNMREVRGVYYTPEPVVSYIVRSIDALLKQDFGLTEGLADSTELEVLKAGSVVKTHQVQILDPATGTGTFLHGVINFIHANYFSGGMAGAWSGYVTAHLLPRLSAFELLMAPYTIAHLKIALQLKELGYTFQSGDRLGIYLTNALEESFQPGKSLWATHVKAEAEAAGKIKYAAPVMVVLGNPPYSGHSANQNDWIKNLLRGKIDPQTASYFEVDGQPLAEKNPKWLNDDYVKFIRFAQWRISQTGYGIVGFITNHGYLDNPTFRGMRQSLLQTFDKIYVLDLHGNTKKKERSPDGSPDQNVFDIQQGVAISLFVKLPPIAVSKTASTPKNLATVHHASLYGSRASKFSALKQQSIQTTEWEISQPQASEYYLFKPLTLTYLQEYLRGWKISDIFKVQSLGITTARDDFSVKLKETEVWNVVNDFVQLAVEEAREKYQLGEDSGDWQVALAQKDLQISGLTKAKLAPILYRPFDTRYTYYTGNSRGFHCRPRADVMKHVFKKNNLSLITTRSIEIERGWEHVFCSRNLTQLHSVSIKEVNYNFPLYLYPSEKQTLFDLGENLGENERKADLVEAFIQELTERLHLQYVPDGKGDLQQTFGPEDIFNYIYAVLHAPSYRSRYAEILEIDFPRLPLTSNPILFRQPCEKGEQVVSFHLLENPQLQQLNMVSFPQAGSNLVEQVKYQPPTTTQPAGRVIINQTQYFEGIAPEVWDFQIGGYQVCQKWLKDRKSATRQLDFNEINQYRRIVVALEASRLLMAEIDQLIEQQGGFPLN